MVRLIELARPRLSRSLGTASKLNRDPAFVRELIAHGEARAAEFLAALAFEDAWRRRDPGAVLARFADDAELVSAPPFPDRGRLRGKAQIGQFVREHLTTDLHVDPTRKQVARDRVTWTVRASRNGGVPVLGGRGRAPGRSGHRPAPGRLALAGVEAEHLVGAADHRGGDVADRDAAGVVPSRLPRWAWPCRTRSAPARSTASASR